MLDDRVRAVLGRLEAEEPRPPGVAVEPTTGRFLFSVCAPQADCEVLEIGGGHGYSTIWLAAGVRNLGGRVLSLERDHECIADWRRNIARRRPRGDGRARGGRRARDVADDRRRLR